MLSEEEKYELWNYMLAETCLLSDTSDGIVQLTITPHLLARALEDAGEGIVAPEDAEASLISSVSAVYASRVLGSPLELRALRSSGTQDVPYATAFLALTVLAAFRMHTDDEHTGAAFYPRLAEMLGCELRQTYPIGFDGKAYAALWEELDGWLRRCHYRRLASPDLTGSRPYLAFPLAHVPLRQLDIDRLPQFFDAKGYEPGARAPIDRLAYDLVNGSGPWPVPDGSGTESVAGPGSPAIRRPAGCGRARALERLPKGRCRQPNSRHRTVDGYPATTRGASPAGEKARWLSGHHEQRRARIRGQPRRLV